MRIIGLDIGTSTISGVLVDTVRAERMSAITLPNRARLTPGAPWEDLQDAEAIVETCRRILSLLCSNGEPSHALGLTGQMHGILYLDAEGRALSPLFTWQDGRGDCIYQQGRTYAEHLTMATGCPMATGYGLTTHFYNGQNGLVPEGAVSLCSVADYVGMRLCSLPAPLMHPSIAHSLGLFDLAMNQFDSAALDAVGIDPGFLPRVSSAEGLLGVTGPGMPVCLPIGDQQASFLGSVKPGAQVLVNIGTGSQLSALSGSILKDSPLETRPYIGGGYLLGGSALCGGSAYRLLRDFFEAALRELGWCQVEDLYARMERLGHIAYHKEQPLSVDTRFKGSREQPGIRGAIRGIGMDNLTPGALVVGVLWGMADELKAFYDLLPEGLQQADFIVGSGNTVRRNALLRKIITEKFGKPLRLTVFSEEAAMGVAILAGSVVGGDRIEGLQQLIGYRPLLNINSE